MDTTASEPACGKPLVLAASGALGFSAVMTQLALMREMLGAFSGNEMVLGIMLGNWFLLTGFGTWLGRTGNRLRNPLGVMIVLLIFVAVLPLVQVFLLRVLRNVVFPRGVIIGVSETVISSFVLLAPYCVVSGFLLTLACAVLARRDGAAGIGRVYVADSIGSVAGGALFSFVFVRMFDHLGILCAPALLNLTMAALIAFRAGRGIMTGLAAVIAAAGVGAVLVWDWDAVSSAPQFPQQKIVFRGNSPYGKLIVTESAGQFNFMENGVPLFSSGDAGQVEETVHYAMIQRPDARKVLLVAGGVSGTAKEILKYGVAEVTYVELDPLIIEAGRRFLPDRLADPRIKVVTTDGRVFIKRTPDRYDVIIVDMPDPSTSRINRFFTAEFFGEARRALSPDGVLSFGLGRYENYVSPALARMLASAHRTLQPVFRNVLMIPGGRVYFLASDGVLHADIAGRIEHQRISNKLVQRHYLGAMLTPDRMEDLRRAVSQPAAVNTDFNPVLYYYHLLHWISQFKVSFGVMEAVVSIVLTVYLLRMRAVALAIFVSGFAASALEVVLLLGFQIICGSLYQQLGVLVTVFMAGLAVGAWLANRRNAPSDHRLVERAMGRKKGGGQDARATVARASCPEPSITKPGDKRTAMDWLRALPGLARVAFIIAAFAALLPVALTMLGRFGGAGGSMVVVQVTIPLLGFLLAALVGMEFPLACRTESGGAANTVRLALFAWRTGFQPVRADSASRLSANETTGWKPVGQDRRDAYPPAKLAESDGAAASASRLYTADFTGAFVGALLPSALLIPLLGVTGVCWLTAGLNVLGGVAVLLQKR